MNYKELIKEYMRDQKYMLIFIIGFIVTIFVGIIIVHELSLRAFIVLVLSCILFIGLYFYRKKKFNDIYENLSEKEQKELDSDINQTYFFSGKDYALSSKYIINFKSPKIIKYSSILIIDKITGIVKHGQHSHTCDMVYIVTKNEKISLILKEYGTIKLQSQYSEGYYEGLYSYIKAQNSNVLEGYTKENRKKIKEKYNIKI